MNRLLHTISLGAMVALAGCSRHGSVHSTAALPTLSVEAASVTRKSDTRFEDVTGTVRPRQQATIAAKVMGTITAVHAALGDEVRAGDVLVEISAAEMDARLAQAEAALAQVTRDHLRESSLLGRGASTADLVNSLLDRKRQAEAAVAEAKAMQGYARVAAPFDGVISGKLVDAGDLASPGDALLNLETGDSLRVDVGLPQSLANLTTGTKLEVYWNDGVVSGELAEISPAADPRSRTVLVRIDVPPGTGLRSGQFVRVRVPAGQSEQLLVPAGAVTTFGQMERVFLVENGRAVLRIVRTAGPGRDGKLRVLSGLEAGDIVVAPVPPGIQDGQPVEVRS